MALLVAKVLIINHLLEILGAKGAEDYKQTIDCQADTDQPVYGRTQWMRMPSRSMPRNQVIWRLAN